MHPEIQVRMLLLSSLPLWSVPQSVNLKNLRAQTRCNIIWKPLLVMYLTIFAFKIQSGVEERFAKRDVWWWFFKKSVFCSILKLFTMIVNFLYNDTIFTSSQKKLHSLLKTFYRTFKINITNYLTRCHIQVIPWGLVNVKCLHNYLYLTPILPHIDSVRPFTPRPVWVWIPGGLDSTHLGIHLDVMGTLGFGLLPIYICKTTL